MENRLPPGGEWKTIKGAKVYIKDGKVLAGAKGKLTEKPTKMIKLGKMSVKELHPLVTYDFGDIPEDKQKAIKKAFKDVAEMVNFPYADREMKFIGSHHTPKKDALFQDAGMDTEIILAYYHGNKATQTSLIAFVDENLDEESDNVYSSNDVSKVLYHEYAHYLQDAIWYAEAKVKNAQASLRGDKKELDFMNQVNEIRNQTIRKYGEDQGSGSYGFDGYTARQVLSPYGFTNTSEFFAEAFSEYVHHKLNNTEPRAVAKVVGLLFEKSMDNLKTKMFDIQKTELHKRVADWAERAVFSGEFTKTDEIKEFFSKRGFHDRPSIDILYRASTEKEEQLYRDPLNVYFSMDEIGEIIDLVGERFKKQLKKKR